MSIAPGNAEIPADFPLINRDTLMTVIAHPLRWAILKILADGEGYGVIDLAPRLHTVRSNASTHLKILKDAGIITVGRGRLYKIHPAYNPNPNSGLLEFGHVLARLNVQKPPA